jgi:alcohol dehydrogenase
MCPDGRSGRDPYEQRDRDITITTGLVDTASIPTLMSLITTGQLQASRLITHRFPADDADSYHRVQCPAAAGKVRC